MLQFTIAGNLLSLALASPSSGQSTRSGVRASDAAATDWVPKRRSLFLGDILDDLAKPTDETAGLYEQLGCDTNTIETDGIAADYDTIPSPRDGIVKLVDSEELLNEGSFDASAEVDYIELPSDIVFVESIAHNENYNKGSAYVVVQYETDVPGVVRSSVYEIQPSVSKEATLLLENIATPNRASTDVSVWGSHLDSNGILYVCNYNHNSVLAYNLSSTTDPEVAIFEIKGLFAPNELALDPQNENIMYIAGGTLEELDIVAALDILGGAYKEGLSDIQEILGTDAATVNFTNPTNGKLYRVDLSSVLSQLDQGATPEQPLVETVASGFGLLVGIEVDNDRVWLSQLYDIFSIDKNDYSNRNIEWDGRHFLNTWWADNIDVFESMILSPAWGPPKPFLATPLLQKPCENRATQIAMQLKSALDEGEDFLPALEDAEVTIAYSNTFVKKELLGWGSGVKPPGPVRLAFIDPSTGEGHHFELHLEDANIRNGPYNVTGSKGEIRQRHYFSEQVTHSSRIPSPSGDEAWIVNVNFETPRLMIVNDKVFKDFMALNKTDEIQAHSMETCPADTVARSKNIFSRKGDNEATGVCHDEPDKFCVDGICHKFNCLNWYLHGAIEFTSWKDGSETDLICEWIDPTSSTSPDMTKFNGARYGCAVPTPGLVGQTEAKLTLPFNQRCHATPHEGVSFECFDYDLNTGPEHFDDYQAGLEEFVLTCGDGQDPSFWFPVTLDQGQQQAGGGMPHVMIADRASSSFDLTMVESVMHAVLTIADVKEEEAADEEEGVMGEEAIEEEDGNVEEDGSSGSVEGDANNAAVAADTVRDIPAAADNADTSTTATSAPGAVIVDAPAPGWSPIPGPSSSANDNTLSCVAAAALASSISLWLG